MSGGWRKEEILLQLSKCGFIFNPILSYFWRKMWNPGRQGEWNACGNKFLFYSRGTQVGTEQFFIRTQMPCSFFGRNIPRLVICSSRWLVDWRFLIQSSDPLIYSLQITPPKKTRNKYFPWKFLPGKMMEQMVASSEGIVRDGELGIRCNLTEPAVQGEDTFLS